jgi:hypothetical protein
MIKYILKQLRRSAVTNALFCLLLTLAGTLLCISAGLWYSAHKALLDIDETITTIAIPDRFAINRFATRLIDYQHPDLNLYSGKDMFLRADKIREAELDVFRRIEDEVYPSGLLQMDQRRLFNAFAEDIDPIALNTVGVGAEPFIAKYSGQAFAVFVVTCANDLLISNHVIHFDQTLVDGEQTNTTKLAQLYEARFFVDEILQLHPNYREPRFINIPFVLNHDGSSPFERNKQYVVAGRFERNQGMGIDELILETPNVEIVSTVFDVVHSIIEFYDFTNTNWSRYIPFLEVVVFPLEVVEYSFVREPNENDGRYSFLEVEGSLAETMASDRWLPMKEAIEINDIAVDSFQVITTNDPNSLLRFNQNRNLFYDGRTFTPHEVNEGARVCLVSREFADFNELTVGDTLPMQFYNTVLGLMEVTYMVSDGIMSNNYFWIPTVYQRGLEISTPEEFTIVGIYNTTRADRSEYAVHPNTVIIPNNSFGELAGEPISIFDTSRSAPILLNRLIVPNGRINETKALIDSIADGYGSLFRFYDQGYNSLLRALGNLRFGMSWILALSAASWIAVLVIFLMFYVTRKRKEASLLYDIGISKLGRFGWVFTQCAVLVLVALGLSIAVSLPIYGDILDVAAGIAQEFTDSFRDLRLSDAADSGLRSNIPLDRSPVALLVTVAGAAIITLFTAGLLSARSSAFKSLSEKGGEN